MERLAAKYTDSIKAHKVAIWIKEQSRDVREDEVMSRAMARSRAETERLERV